MAVEMIGGPRLCEPLLATGLGRFTGAASRHAVWRSVGMSPLSLHGLNERCPNRWGQTAAPERASTRNQS